MIGSVFAVSNQQDVAPTKTDFVFVAVVVVGVAADAVVVDYAVVAAEHDVVAFVYLIDGANLDGLDGAAVDAFALQLPE